MILPGFPMPMPMIGLSGPVYTFSAPTNFLSFGVKSLGSGPYGDKYGGETGDFSINSLFRVSIDGGPASIIPATQAWCDDAGASTRYTFCEFDCGDDDTATAAKDWLASNYIYLRDNGSGPTMRVGLFSGSISSGLLSYGGFSDRYFDSAQLGLGCNIELSNTY